MTDNTLKRLSGLAINEEGFAFDPRSGESFTVNGTGRLIIQGLIAGQQSDDIARGIADDYILDVRQVRADIRDFLEQLRALNLFGESA